MTNVDAYLAEHRQEFEEDLKELLRIPSVSADPAFRGDVRRAAEWVAGHLRKIGCTAELIETPGHPIVFGQSPPVAGAPTVLVYGHYDVQPPDPLDEWISPPFEPTIRDGNIYARGATDDKGQFLTHLKSVQAWIATAGRPPVNVKFLIEGEEEVGSENLNRFLEHNRERLACDVAVISDGSQFGDGIPAITYGLRGIAYFELTVQGPSQDLHSGVFGGAVMNPAVALTKMLASLIDDDGRITVPGFYDDVVPLTEQERRQFAELPFDEQAFMRERGVTAVAGEEGYTTLERRWVRPTFDIHGLTSGYQGEGGKTVLPARASAKFSFRLVPRQNPKKIAASLQSMLEKHCPVGATYQLVELHGVPGVVVPIDSPFVNAARRALELAFGCRPALIREGGSIPVVNSLSDQLGVNTLLLGFGLDSDNMHSPNEKFRLADFHRGTAASAHLWREIAAIH